MSRRDLLLGLAVCVAAGAAGFGGYRFLHPQQAAALELRPDLEFHDLKGASHRLSEWSGKLLLVNFWASWCAPCLKEIPMLVEAQRRETARGLQVVGVAMDEVQPVAEMSQRLQINYPVMAGGAEVAQAMDALGEQLGALPFSVLISPDGHILARASGALTSDELHSWLANLPP